MAVDITENWIRDRVDLRHNRLEDVRSLSLPGTYHEKIGTLGESLYQFARLKILDLSRNALQSLKGLEKLHMLENLNLYYNCVDSMEEVMRLRANKSIEELDLRLNPVGRTEPDYRLLIIDMLPNLRRLDDRSVRDNERRAALLHFSSERKTLTDTPEIDPPTKENKVSESKARSEHVRSLARPPTALSNDDANLMDFMQPKYEEEFLYEKKPHVEDYSDSALRQMNRGKSGFTESSVELKEQDLHGTFPTQPVTQSNQPPASYVNLTSKPSADGNSKNTSNKYSQHQKSDDANLRFADEPEAYGLYKATGHFTYKPDYPQQLQQEIGQGDPRLYSKEPEDRPSNPANGSATVLPSDNKFLQQFSDLVDKYWNGSKSLAKNVRFSENLQKLMREAMYTDRDSELASLRSEVEHLRRENRSFIAIIRQANSLCHNAPVQNGQRHNDGNTAIHQKSEFHEPITELSSKVSQLCQMQESLLRLQEKHTELISRNGRLLKELTERDSTQK